MPYIVETRLYYLWACTCVQSHDLEAIASLLSRVLSRKIIWGGKLVLRAVLVAPGGGCGRGVCPLPREARKLSPF